MLRSPVSAFALIFKQRENVRALGLFYTMSPCIFFFPPGNGTLFIMMFNSIKLVPLSHEKSFYSSV